MPPNPNDPCSTAGRDGCATTGVGRYATYQYGLRWFGDYRGAIGGLSGATFCIDLRFWYPSRSYDYQQRSAAGLHNRAGQAVPDTNLHEMAYAIWQYGRSSSVNQQSATMLYVHGLMGDAAPGEVAPTVLGATVHGIYDQITAAAAKYAGPYQLIATLPASATSGLATTLKLSVRAASGALLPGVRFTLSAAGGASVPATATSNSSGTAS